MRTTRVLALVAALGASLVATVPAEAASSSAPDNAGSFIVTLKDGVDSRSAAAEYRRHGVDVSHVYGSALNGFAGTFSDGALGELRADGRVRRIERDGVVKATAVTSWGLDRLDQRYLNLDQQFGPEGDGSGVHAYVIDTGIRSSHTEFLTGGGLPRRIGNGYSAITDGNGTEDCNGHGTHVAATVGGSTFGIARGVTLHPVRVLSCSGSGTWSGVIAGMDWVRSQVTAGGSGFRAVANMSLGGGLSSSVNEAASNLGKVATTAVAAGNDNRDARNYSPASAPDVLTVGATTSTDARASYSNYGPYVELFAPGSSITSAWSGSDVDQRTISGTSMASPHVAGVAAALAATRDVAAVKSALGSSAYLTDGVVGSAGTGSPNKLLFNGSLSGHSPTVKLTGSCTSTTCAYTAEARDPDGDPATFVWEDDHATADVAPGSTSATAFGKTTETATSPAANGMKVTVSVASDGGSSSAAVRVSCSRKGKTTTCRLTAS